ncbi:MAG: hypothetical protein JKY48_01235 [Flavobacteriales bacterium]|nr:hypothetical protein [Flavobacteriales bacterium]
MRYLFIFIALSLSLNGLAQHSTLRFTDCPIDLNRQSLLLVPFESKMYSSDINKKLAEANQMNAQEIIQRFTAAIDQSILYTFQERCDVSSFYQLEGQDITQDLNYIFDNLELDYELVSNTVEKSRSEKLKEKLKKKKDNSYQRGSIQGGQVVTKRDVRERYMKAVVKDQKMLDSMHFKFDNKFFLFVNQLDIRNDYSDMIAVQQGSYDRIIQIHYTLYQKDGTILTTGISKTSFPSRQNDINQIIKNNFPILAQYIYDDLFPPVEEESSSKLKIKNLWK